MMGKVERKKGRKKDEREIISSNFCELVFLLFFKLQLLLSKCKKKRLFLWAINKSNQYIIQRLKKE